MACQRDVESVRTKRWIYETAGIYEAAAAPPFFQALRSTNLKLIPHSFLIDNT